MQKGTSDQKSAAYDDMVVMCLQKFSFHTKKIVEVHFFAQFNKLLQRAPFRKKPARDFLDSKRHIVTSALASAFNTVK